MAINYGSCAKKSNNFVDAAILCRNIEISKFRNIEKRRIDNNEILFFTVFSLKSRAKLF